MPRHSCLGAAGIQGDATLQREKRFCLGHLMALAFLCELPGRGLSIWELHQPSVEAFTVPSRAALDSRHQRQG